MSAKEVKFGVDARDNLLFLTIERRFVHWAGK